MNPFGRALDRWLGRGEASITVPPMDGALRPNDLLDSAEAILETPAPDSLALTSRGIVVSSERALFGIDTPGTTPLASFDAEITALTGLPDGGAAVALIDGRIAFVGGKFDGRTIAAVSGISCITALAPARDGALLVANGSASHGPAEWKRDLMEKNASGSVWRLEPNGGARDQVAAKLAYPYGLLEDDGSLIVSESWRSALTRVRLGGNGRNETVLGNLPAYPSRLSRGADGTVWLALFAPRSQLVEFVLSETAFRQRMLKGIDSEHWVAPCLRSGRGPHEPIQQGGVKQLGILKPWAPSRSYGLVVRLDRTYRPVASLHSRANGRRHGVTSCLAIDGRLYFVAKGDGVVASLPYEGSPS